MQCVSKVELRISCENLIDRDVSSKSDPCCILQLKNAEDKWVECGRTEQIENSHHPKFTQVIPIDYYFEKVQKVRLVIYDVDNSSITLKDDDFLGRVTTTLGQVVSQSPFTASLTDFDGEQLKGSHGKSTITVLAEEVSGNNNNIMLTFRGRKLDKKDLLGKSDPFLEVCKSASDGKWYPVCKTEVLKNTLEPSWRPIEMSLQSLCGGDYSKQIQVNCYDWDSDGSHDLIGTFTTTVTEMLKAIDAEVEYKCINPKKAAKKKSYDNSGFIYVSSCQIVRVYSFLEFIFGGLQINFTVGIDYTGSNGDPKDPSSLHYINIHHPNEYISAITSVGQVCQDYDSDKMFPALGFGAKLPDGTVSHEFPLNFNAASPFCCGINGIIEAYKNSFQYVKLWGPTNFAPLIYHVAQFALAAQNEYPAKQSYFVLLIITDGAITDIVETIQALGYASSLPMSIIICGVGDADFTEMSILDGDDGSLEELAGSSLQRDIVQFVPFREYAQSGPAVMAQQVLAEVPRQVTEYFKKRGIVPGPPRAM